MLTILVSLHLAGFTLQHVLSSYLDLFPKDQTTTKGPGNQEIALLSTNYTDSWYLSSMFCLHGCLLPPQFWPFIWARNEVREPEQGIAGISVMSSS